MRTCKTCGIEVPARYSYCEPHRKEQRNAVLREINRKCRERKGEQGREDNRAYLAQYRETEAERLHAYDAERRLDPVRQESQRRSQAKLKSDPVKRQRYLDQIKAHSHRRRGAPGNFTAEEWQALLASYEGKCLCCGTTEHIQADHVIPLSRGGTNTIDNLQPLCKTCNRQKMTQTIDYR